MHGWVRKQALMAALLLGTAATGAQAPGTIVREVRAAVACTAWPCSPTRDFSAAEALLAKYRAANGTTSEALEALSWLGRAALAGKQLDKASAFAEETYRGATAALKSRSLVEDRRLETALGAAIEVQAQVGAERGQRSEAVAFLRAEMERYKDTPLHRRIQKNLHLLSLQGQKAPAVERGRSVGPPMPGLDGLRGKVVVLFFWAHWCPDCKAQAPILTTLLERHRHQGLFVAAPTQLYGYVARGKQAAPDEELRYITQMRDDTYPFLRDLPVPVSEDNHTRYGVSTTPTLVVTDRTGIVRLYHPGRITEEELSKVLRPLLETT
jgi:thiol-disulfide isomerase/thioredoxin